MILISAEMGRIRLGGFGFPEGKKINKAFPPICMFFLIECFGQNSRKLPAKPVFEYEWLMS
jgi:hypothetical protein